MFWQVVTHLIVGFIKSATVVFVITHNHDGSTILAAFFVKESLVFFFFNISSFQNISADYQHIAPGQSEIRKLQM
jgi:hypothetical protein